MVITEQALTTRLRLPLEPRYKADLVTTRLKSWLPILQD